jgi:hypothetical protein
LEAVIKIGGSLANRPTNLKRLCRQVVALAKKHKLLIVPGGGRFADIVREVDRTHKLSTTAAHLMAVLGTDQYGILLSSTVRGAQTVKDLKGARQLQSKGLLPILLPSKMTFEDNYLEHSWNVTSDSIAARIAGLSHANMLILVKDVDGIFGEDPKEKNAEIIRELRLSELRLLDQTCVDSFLPRVLRKHRLECYVVNGGHPGRIAAILEGASTVCTRIKP